MAPEPFEIVDGNIRVTGRTPGAALGPLAQTRAAQWLLSRNAVRKAAAAVRLGRFVRETARYIVAELRPPTGVRTYHLRSTGQPILLRHGTEDVWTFTEVFDLGMYEPPPVVAAAIPDAPAILDLGANIGLFDAWALARWPNAVITAFEPDPDNFELLEGAVRTGPASERVTLRRAAAGKVAGTASFMSGQFNESRLASEDQSTIEVAVEDVLPIFEAVDLAKIDIEGSEWEILADERFGAAAVVALEYHPWQCPARDSHEAADAMLAARGYQVHSAYRGADGVGMVWGVRESTRS
jgi:FkbM family methyltransferase